MAAKTKNIESLQAEADELRHLLFEANETIEAIRTGQVDALVLEGENGHELYTLRTADRTFRVFIEKMTEGALTLNRDGMIVYCNSQFATLVSQPLSKVIGMPFDQFINEESREKFNALFDQCWERDCKAEISINSADSPVDVLLSLTALQLDDGIALSVIITDLSALKATQQQLGENVRQLAAMNNALELSNHDLQQFASVASHDLQEPLRKIKMFAALLQEKDGTNLSKDSLKYMDKIVDAASRMKRLIIDILNYSRLSANEKSFESVDLNEIIKELLEDFELIIQEKNAVIEVGHLPLIEANRGQLRQVFQNILSNALKFSKKSENPIINISANLLKDKAFNSAQGNDGRYCVISIKDNGIGFDEKYLGNIFALFERLHSKDSYEGTGIGLAITKKIIEKHNGLISAKSEPGKGAEFLLLLPVQQNNPR